MIKINLKILVKSLFALTVVSIILVSCTKTESEVQDGTNINSLAEESYNHQKLMTIEDLHNIVVANEGNIRSRSCGDQYPGGLPCPAHATEAFNRSECYYGVYYNNPSNVNWRNFEIAFCDYILAYNSCCGTSHQCP